VSALPVLRVAALGDKNGLGGMGLCLLLVFFVFPAE
jgi:hypothetical protein